MTREEYERIERGEVVWIRNNPGDRISWKHSNEDNMVFRFDDDPKTEYYLYRDYKSLSGERKFIFDKENPYWAAFFRGEQ